MPAHPHLADTDIFQRHRRRLFGIAYRMLGSVEDAEDVVQESWLRWHRADPDELHSPEGWLVSVTTRIAIDRLRRAATERERYTGHWLPEPIATAPDAADRDAELASDLSMAFLVLLERLGPEERAPFLLHDVFDSSYADIARVLDRSEAACRQLVHRARLRVRGDRVRFPVPGETHERLLEGFLRALQADDQEAMLELITADATWTSDGGGKVPSTRRIVSGAPRIVRLVLGYERKMRRTLRHELAWINGESAIVTRAGGRIVFTTAAATDGERLVAFYRVLNPDKLRHTEAGRSGAQRHPQRGDR
jgi:RNA polymerase sigma-70 factor (ECF subfamily)